MRNVKQISKLINAVDDLRSAIRQVPLCSPDDARQAELADLSTRLRILSGHLQHLQIELIDALAD